MAAPPKPPPYTLADVETHVLTHSYEDSYLPLNTDGYTLATRLLQLRTGGIKPTTGVRVGTYGSQTIGELWCFVVGGEVVFFRDDDPDRLNEGDAYLFEAPLPGYRRYEDVFADIMVVDGTEVGKARDMGNERVLGAFVKWVLLRQGVVGVVRDGDFLDCVREACRRGEEGRATILRGRGGGRSRCR